MSSYEEKKKKKKASLINEPKDIYDCKSILISMLTSRVNTNN